MLDVSLKDKHANYIDNFSSLSCRDVSHARSYGVDKRKIMHEIFGRESVKQDRDLCKDPLT